MYKKIEEIEISCFRGIISSELKLNGKSLLIQGDNGTGKSSFVDAIEYFFTGEVDHLMGTRGLSITRHAPHVKCSKRNSRIGIKLINEEMVEREFGKSINKPKELENYFISMEEQKFILHRLEILEFILSQPAERFRAIGNLVGIGDLDDIELQMKHVKNYYANKRSSIKEDLEEIWEELSSNLDIKIKDEREILAALNKKLNSISYPSLSSIENIENYINKNFLKSPVYEEVGKINIKINQIINNKHKISDLSSIVKIINKLKDLSAKLSKREIQKTEILHKIIKHGYEYISIQNPRICPLCEQNINSNTLKRKLKKRLKVYDRFSKEFTTYKKNIDRLEDLILSKIDFIKSLMIEIEEFEDLKKFLIHFKNLNEMLISLKKIKIDHPKDFGLFIKEFNREKEKYIKVCDELFTKFKNSFYSPNKKKEKEEFFEIFNLISSISRLVKNLKKKQKELLKYKRYASIAKKIYSIFSKVKKNKIQEIYDNLGNDICNFYDFIHQDDPHENIKLIIDPRKRASTNLCIDSFGKKKVDPRALTSEGHLDTLGLCIFLAFIKHFNKNCSLVILDDVVTSVDANHRERIAEMIMNEFQDFQLIITTHDFIWFKQLRMSQIINNCQHNFINEKIINWSVDTGPKLIKFKPSWEKIQDRLDEGDKLGAGALSRSYLEWILKKLCEIFEVSVKYKRDSRYTVSQLYDPAVKKIKKILNKREDNPPFKCNILMRINKLKRRRFMINLLAHDNSEIDELSLKEVEDFCFSVHEFYKVFTCPNCSNILKYEKSLKKIQCINSNCSNPFVYNITNPFNLKINGNVIQDLLGINPSPLVGRILDYLQALVERGELENDQQILENYILEHKSKLMSLEE